MIEKLSHRTIEKRDFETICSFPQNLEELFFMFPRAEYPLTVNQLETAVETDFTLIFSRNYHIDSYLAKIKRKT